MDLDYQPRCQLEAMLALIDIGSVKQMLVEQYAYFIKLNNFN